jgi:hypothetical protein
MHPAERSSRALLAAALSAAVAHAHAQDARPGLTVPANMQPRPEAVAPAAAEAPKPVDSTVADRNSLSESLRLMPVDLSPHGFERVYSVPGRDDLLMRSNGALYAVFSQSLYGRDPKRGTSRVLIPAATVFYIGRPDFSSIRGSAVRDVDLSPADARASAPSGAEDSVHGVRRVEPAPIDARIDGGEHRIDGASDGRCRAPGRPADDPPVDVVHGPPSPSPVRAAPEAAPAPNDSRGGNPGFERRIDELMRRARQPK